MKKLITTYNGGMPIVLDDIRWLESGIIDSIKGFLNHVNTDELMILSGCDYNPEEIGDVNNITITDGYLYFNGEVYPFTGGSIALTPGNVFYWNEKTTYDPAGNITFEDSSTHDVYQIKEFEILQAPTVPVGKVAVMDEFNIFDVYKSKISERTKYNNPFLTTVSPFGSSFPNDVLLYSIGIDKRVYLQGAIVGIPDSGFSGKIATLKTEIIPSNRIKIPISIIDDSSNQVLTPGTLIIYSNGDVFLYSQAYAPGPTAQAILNASYLLD